MVFHWSLSDSKSPQVSRTLLSILAVLDNAVVWMVSTRPPTSKSSSPFSNPLVTVPNPLITIGIIVTCMFHCFFNPLARSRYYYYYYLLFESFFFFYISVNWWSFPEVWVTGSLLKSPELFSVFWPISKIHCTLGWGYRIHRLHICRGIRPFSFQRVSWIWHRTIWWWCPIDARALGNVEHPFIAIAPRSTLARNGSTW